MSRVLVLSDLWLPFPGGAERLIYNVARYLQADGHQVHAITGYENAASLADGPPLTQALDVPLTADGWLRLAGLIEQHDPDVVLVHHLWGRVFGAQLGQLGRPLVHLVENGDRIPEADVAVFISRYVARQTSQRVGDLVLWPWAEPDVVADRHGPAVGFIKPYPHKGADRVYRIATAMPDRQFVVLRGEWPTEELLPGVDLPNVEFMPPVADMRDFWRRVRLVLAPSVSEDAGTVAQEATANGLPCISTNVGGLAETNPGGVQLDPETPTYRWVQAINRLLPDGRARAGRLRLQREGQATIDPRPTLAELSERIRGMG